MKLGMVGLPNVGKSTLFNALTNAGAESANYPFCTIEKNIGIVSVPDERLDKLAEMYEPDKFTPATLEFVDIAGLVKGASKGEGLGNKFLSHILTKADGIAVAKEFVIVKRNLDYMVFRNPTGYKIFLERIQLCIKHLHP